MSISIAKIMTAYDTVITFKEVEDLVLVRDPRTTRDFHVLSMNSGQLSIECVAIEGKIEKGLTDIVGGESNSDFKYDIVTNLKHPDIVNDGRIDSKRVRFIKVGEDWKTIGRNDVYIGYKDNCGVSIEAVLRYKEGSNKVIVYKDGIPYETETILFYKVPEMISLGMIEYNIAVVYDLYSEVICMMSDDRYDTIRGLCRINRDKKGVITDVWQLDDYTDNHIQGIVSNIVYNGDCKTVVGGGQSGGSRLKQVITWSYGFGEMRIYKQQADSYGEAKKAPIDFM
jgi:hypothetical protein